METNKKVYWGNDIQGWMSNMELQFLYQQASRCQSVLEIGSWKGRSTHALLSGCPGTVTAVDHFQGSAQVGDATNWMGKTEDVYGQFQKNLAGFDNLEVLRMSSDEAKLKLGDTKFDMIFIDGEHSYEAVKHDIVLWKDNAGIILCGHDYCVPWPPVMQAVDESIQKDGVCDSIWFKYTPKPSLLEMFTKKIRAGENFSFVKRGDGEEACMAILGVKLDVNKKDYGGNCDGSKYTPELAKKLLEAYEYFAEKDNVFVPLFNEQAYYNTFLHRTDNDLDKLRNFYGAIREDKRNKIYVGPKRLKIVASLLKTKHIVVPEQNGFEAYEDISKQLKMAVTVMAKNNIVLFSFGMMAKPLIREVLMAGDNTCIDLGSAWDPIVGITRTVQVSRADMIELYGDWLIKDCLPE
jgi:hypothetical protein